MDQQTERMVRNDIRIRNAPIVALFLIAILSIVGVAGIAFLAEMMRL